nr:hypothetical protein [Tanacetum cinerariifolium]
LWEIRTSKSDFCLELSLVLLCFGRRIPLEGFTMDTGYDVTRMDCDLLLFIEVVIRPATFLFWVDGGFSRYKELWRSGGSAKCQDASKSFTKKFHLSFADSC